MKRMHFPWYVRLEKHHSCDLTAVRDHDWLGRLARLRADGLNGLDDIHALRHSAEDDVLAIEPLRLDRAQEELRAVGVRACVRHREDTWPCMLQREVLVGELLPVDRLSASPIACGE